MLSEVYPKIRNAIVAFVPRHHEQIRAGSTPHEFIFGTGFIVGESLVATNAHVAEVFKQFPGTGDDDYDVDVLIFAKLPQGMVSLKAQVKKTVVINRIEGEGIHYGTGKPDLALVAIDCRGLEEVSLELDTTPLAEGQRIATSGFPMGSILLHLEGQLDHFSPTLQEGIVSAALPFPDTFPHGYLIQTMALGGSSGSPVFLPDTGSVVGVVYASRLNQVSISNPFQTELSAQVPINLAHVVPSHFLKLMLDEKASELRGFVSKDAPTLTEILQSIPKEPKMKFSEGKFSRRS